MKRYYFGQAEINISQGTLERGVRACLSQNEFSRRSLSIDAKTNESYSGRILNALDSCKLIYQTSFSPPYLYAISKNVVTLVLDISRSNFSSSLIDAAGECLFYNCYESLSDLTYSENLHSFLSRLGITIKKMSFPLSSICVIWDGCHNETKQLIDGILADVCGMIPLLYVSLQEAVSAIFDFKLVPSIQDKSAAYIGFSDKIRALHRNEIGEAIFCDTSRLIFENDLSISSVYNEAYSSTSIGEIAARIMTAMEFFGDVSAYVIECDRLRIDSQFTEAIRRTYSVIRHSPPEIYASSMSPGYLAAAAAKLASAELILSLIKAK